MRTRVWCFVLAPIAAVASVLPAVRAQVSGPPAPPGDDTATIAHVLNRITYGPRPGDIEQVRAEGIAAYIDRQLEPDRIDDRELDERLTAFETLELTSGELAERYFLPAQRERRERQRTRAAAEPGSDGTSSAGDGAAAAPRMAGEAMRAERQVLAELMEQKLLRAVDSERQLQEVMVDFWFNHFNVFAGKGATRQYLIEYERDVIRPHALGRFRDLLGAVAASPAMLSYLDNWMSADPDGDDPVAVLRDRMTGGAFGRAGRPGARARAGRNRRPADGGEPRRRAGLNENYARELMELHTLGVDAGYTQQDVVEVARVFTGWTIDNPRRGGGFRFEPRIHDEGDKTVLGQTIRSGGRDEGERVLDLLAQHPATARFVATKLARRFVADEPPASLVDRAAETFPRTRGDIRGVLRTILLSDEFLDPAYRRAKVKTPLEFVASALRATGAPVASARALARTLREMGMPLYFAQPPTGYADTADAWVNTGALVARMNFAVALVGNRLRGVSVDLSRFGSDDLAGARDRLVTSLLQESASAATVETLDRSTSLAQMAALTIGSPEFQWK